MVFHWSLSDSKSPQVPRTLLNILDVLNNEVVSMVSSRPLISKSSSSLNNPLVTVPKAPITIGIIVTFMFHNFFQFPSNIEVRILLFTFFQFYSVVSWDSKVHNIENSLSFCWSGLLAEIRWSVCMSKSHRSLCVSFSRTDDWLLLLLFLLLLLLLFLLILLLFVVVVVVVVVVVFVFLRVSRSR